MYSVSDAYIETMLSKATRRRLTGTIGDIAFTGADINVDSFTVTGRAAEESDTKIGGVFLSELDMTFVPSFINKLARDKYQDKEVAVFIGLYVEDEWIDVPVGVYILQAPKISKDGISVHGYDHMIKLDKTFNIDTTSATPWEYLSYIALQCGVEIGMTQAEVEVLPNGSDVLGLYTENDIETYRDFVYWLAQSLGCFACADRLGKIVLRKFGNKIDITLDERHRDVDVIFSGYTTKWTGISVVDMQTKFTNYYGLEQDDGLTMNLGSNPLLQYGTSGVVAQRRRNVLNAIAEIQYTPFYCNSARDPIFDLGDEIKFTGGISGNSTGVIMAYTYSLDNFTFEGYGDDPALANGRSKTDKNIAGLLSSTKENEVTYHNFTNLSALTFGSEREISIAKIAFTAAQKTTVKIMHEFIFDMIADLSQNASYELRYYLNEQLLTYCPYEQIGGIEGVSEGSTEFSICRDFFYILSNIDPGTRNTWEVRIITHGIDSTTIGVEHAHISLEGQRLYGDEYFDGVIDVSDNITAIAISGVESVGLNETVLLGILADRTNTASDSLSQYELTSLPTDIEEGTVGLNIVYNEDMISFLGEGLYTGEDMDTSGMNLLYEGGE